MERKYFGTDGVRGTANSAPMTAAFVLKLGMATGIYFRDKGGARRVAIAKDTRLSGYMFESALVAGFASVGMDVLQLGPMPTPALSMLTRSLRADIGVMISASHNYFSDNGIKLFASDGYKLSDIDEAAIEDIIDNNLSPDLISQSNLDAGSEVYSNLSPPDDLGRAQRIDDAQARYIEFAKRTIPRGLNLAGLRVVIDCANGAGYKLAPQVLWELGAEVIAINNKPNGFNINKECGSTHLQSLLTRVREVRADIGIALDGDADRVIIVDELGNVLDGDHILAAIATYWCKSDRLHHNTVVSTVMSNLGLENYLNSLAINLERVRVGDRYVMALMRDKGYNLGGEQSGHIVMTDFVATGDGLLAALQILTIMSETGKTASAVCNLFTPVPQIKKNISYKKDHNFAPEVIENIVNSGQSRLGKNGRLVVRRSGTEPLIRIMSEAEDEQLAQKVVDDVIADLRQVEASKI